MWYFERLDNALLSIRGENNPGYFDLIVTLSTNIGNIQRNYFALVCLVGP